jgi:hypothetical protein
MPTPSTICACRPSPRYRRGQERCTQRRGGANLDRHRKGKAATSKEGREAEALQRWQDLNPEVLHYKGVFANGTLHQDALEAVRGFLA